MMILNRQDARNAKDGNFRELLFLATLAALAVNFILIRGS